MDSCYSGTVCDLKWSFEYDANINKHVEIHYKTKKSVEKGSMMMFSGCDTQTSADIFNKDDRITKVHSRMH